MAGRRRVSPAVQALFEQYTPEGVVARRLPRKDALRLMANEYGLSELRGQELLEHFDADQNGFMSLWEFQHFVNVIGNRARARARCTKLTVNLWGCDPCIPRSTSGALLQHSDSIISGTHSSQGRGRSWEPGIQLAGIIFQYQTWSLGTTASTTQSTSITPKMAKTTNPTAPTARTLTRQCQSFLPCHRRPSTSNCTYMVINEGPTGTGTEDVRNPSSACLDRIPTSGYRRYGAFRKMAGNGMDTCTQLTARFDSSGGGGPGVLCLTAAQVRSTLNQLTLPNGECFTDKEKDFFMKSSGADMGQFTFGQFADLIARIRLYKRPEKK